MRRFFPVVLVFLFSLFGCDTGSTNPGHHSPEELANAKSRPAPRPAEPQPQRAAGPVNTNGEQLFAQYCAGCHQGGKNGPPLEGIMSRREFPSGTPANDARLQDTIEMGRAMMPGFRDVLTEEQIRAIMAYVHTL